MKLIEQVKGFLEATDTEDYLSYTSYVTDLLSRGITPVTAAQWDMIASYVGNRQMQYTDVERAYRANMALALQDEESKSKKAKK